MLLPLARKIFPRCLATLPWPSGSPPPLSSRFLAYCRPPCPRLQSSPFCYFVLPSPSHFLFDTSHFYPLFPPPLGTFPVVLTV